MTLASFGQAASSVARQDWLFLLALGDVQGVAFDPDESASSESVGSEHLLCVHVLVAICHAARRDLLVLSRHSAAGV